MAGAGAVGTYLGGKLALSGQEVFFLNRNKEYCRTLNTQGFTIIEKGAAVQGKAAAFQTTQSLFSAHENIDLCLVTVKGFSTRPLLSELSPFLNQILHFCDLQNGIGNEEILATFVKEEKITSGSLTTACGMEIPGTVRAENKGGAAFSSMDPNHSPQFVADLFEKAGMRVKICRDWKSMKWSKLFLNIIGNGTSAVLEMTPQEIFSSRLGFKIERKGLMEAVSVMEKCGIKPVSLPFQPLPLYIFGIKYLPEPILQNLFKKMAAKGRGEKLPSLYYDLLKGKKETEASFLYGPLIDKAKSFGIPVPVLQTVYDLLLNFNPDERQIYRKNPNALYERISKF